MRKRLFSFKDFLSEALRDEVSQHHIDIIKNYNAEHLLDIEIPEKTDAIIEGKWKLSKSEKDEALSEFFGFNYDKAEQELSKFNVDNHFIETINKAYIRNNEHEMGDVKKPSLQDIKYFYEKSFKTISAGETKNDKYVIRDDNGVPIRDENGNIQNAPKKSGDIIWSNNIGNINDFITSYKNAFSKKFYNPYSGDGVLPSLPSRLVDEFFDINLFNNFDLYLYITGKPSDILNQSMTKFYYSCQTLYREEKGFYDIKPLMANVFDKNTKISFLIFDTPWTDHHDKVYPFTAFSRMFIRLHNGEIFFDAVYPLSMQDYMCNIIEEKTGMKSYIDHEDAEGMTYDYTTPDEYARHSYLDVMSPVWKHELPLKELLKDIKFKTLSEYLKTTSIERIKPSVYKTQKGIYLIYTEKENEQRIEKEKSDFKARMDAFNHRVHLEVINHIKDMVVYKQDTYKKYLNVDNFIAVEKNKFLKGYTGSNNFDDIAKWAEENDISKHNLYRSAKPFIKNEFWIENLSDENVKRKIDKFIEGNTDKIPQPADKDMGKKFDIGNNLVMYKQVNN